jgi:hypothetical protein
MAPPLPNHLTVRKWLVVAPSTISQKRPPDGPAHVSYKAGRTLRADRGQHSVRARERERKRDRETEKKKVKERERRGGEGRGNGRGRGGEGGG